MFWSVFLLPPMIGCPAGIGAPGSYELGEVVEEGEVTELGDDDELFDTVDETAANGFIGIAKVRLVVELRPVMELLPVVSDEEELVGDVGELFAIGSEFFLLLLLLESPSELPFSPPPTKSKSNPALSAFPCIMLFSVPRRPEVLKKR